MITVLSINDNNNSSNNNNSEKVSLRLRSSSTSICKLILFFQFFNLLFLVDSRTEERKLRFKAETLHGTKGERGELLRSASLVAISRWQIKLGPVSR